MKDAVHFGQRPCELLLGVDHLGGFLGDRHLKLRTFYFGLRPWMPSEVAGFMVAIGVSTTSVCRKSVVGAETICPVIYLLEGIFGVECPRHG